MCGCIPSILRPVDSRVYDQLPLLARERYEEKKNLSRLAWKTLSYASVAAIGAALLGRAMKVKYIGPIGFIFGAVLGYTEAVKTHNARMDRLEESYLSPLKQEKLSGLAEAFPRLFQTTVSDEDPAQNTSVFINPFTGKSIELHKVIDWLQVAEIIKEAKRDFPLEGCAKSLRTGLDTIRVPALYQRGVALTQNGNHFVSDGTVPAQETKFLPKDFMIKRGSQTFYDACDDGFRGWDTGAFNAVMNTLKSRPPVEQAQCSVDGKYISQEPVPGSFAALRMVVELDGRDFGDRKEVLRRTIGDLVNNLEVAFHLNRLGDFSPLEQ